MTSQRPLRRAAASARLVPWLAVLTLATGACRADIDGYWEGTIGDEHAFLSLDQAGSVIRGEACIGGSCDQSARGEIVDERLQLSFGCHSCDGLRATTLDVSVYDGQMEGLAYMSDCLCPEDQEDCECVFRANLTRTDHYKP